MGNKSSIKKILLTGGGTAGSVSPLLAIAQSFGAKDGFEFVFVGTKKGVEKQMVKEIGLAYRAIAAGKLRRYFSWQNFWDICKIKLGFWQAFFLILREKPNLIISAGSFVSVPVVWAGALLRVPVLIHQQDVRPGLANKLMAPFARVITVTFEKSLVDYGKKAVWTGNPARKFSGQEKNKKLNLKNSLPVVFVVGGGTGAEGINKLVADGLNNLLVFCQIIHSTGAGKMVALRHENYHPAEFLNAIEMAEAINRADLIVSRAGLGILTEISAAGKPAIIIPMPDSHQEDNAAILLEKNAAVVLNQKILTTDELVIAIREILKDENKKRELGKNIKTLMRGGASEEIAKIIQRLLTK